MELYRTFRPTDFKDVYGQRETINTITKLINKGTLPHGIMIVGPSGVGKTTILRIIAKLLGCLGHDLCEKNCADFRGIEDVRGIRDRLSASPMGKSKARVWILDEAQQLNSLAQNCLLKILEEAPDHVYIMLATTKPQALIKTIRTRLMEFKLKTIDDPTLEKLLSDIAKKAEIKLRSAVREKIVSVSEGSPRKALVLLHQVSLLKKETEQIEVIEAADIEADGLQIARLLMNPYTKWPQMAKVLKACKEKDSDAEALRRQILGYGSAILLNGKQSNRAAEVIYTFRKNFYDSGFPELVGSCYQILAVKR